MDRIGGTAVTKLALEEVNIGTWTYEATDQASIALYHRDGSSNLYVTTRLYGTNHAPPATFVLGDIKAVDLALVSSVPGALESTTVRCALETDSNVIYKCDVAEAGGAAYELNCHLVTMKASVYKVGEMRDMLLQLKAAGDQIAPDDQKTRPELRGAQLDALPPWVYYIPPWLYRRRIRVGLEKLLLVYTVLSVLWACWQLYRHVNIIHVTFEPFIVLLKKYLASVMETFDTALVIITEIWAHWFSPLSIFMGTVLAPVLRLVQSGITPFLQLCRLLNTNISQLLASSSVVSLVKGLFQTISLLGAYVWKILTILVWPIYQLCLYVASCPLAVASLDISRVRFNWVLGMITSSSKAIGKGVVKLLNYFLRQQKRRKAHLQRTPTRFHMDAARKANHTQSPEQDKCTT